ncbi:putative peptidase m20 [Diaporthe ampelina]|uniref:Peptidase M20 domain-containing protein 2 n=1 Tax=Diaporthe ampelina TaxID=1214573 RepID=A0A0G2FLA5_9PEZI|nr:putative peptidase m20 [Diaporthe ampelina]
MDQDDDWVLVSHDDDDNNDEPKPPYLGDISSYVDSIADSLWPVNKTIHDNPELGYEEHVAHDTLVRFMRSQGGWKVTPSAYGLETAWIAVHDTGRKGPVVSFNVEMDALVGIGHACGHNLIATASLAGGLAVAELMRQHSLPGKVILFGTPAEEGGGGKIKLIRAGAYRDHAVDLNLISHPGITHDSALMRTTAYTRFKVEYFGREAHAAADPWLGINALDALITAYNSLSVLRQQTMPGDIIQGHITDGGAAPNIIHAHAAGVFVARADTRARLGELKKKVDACFEAGATAAGAGLRVTEEQTYADHVPNRVLARSYTRYFNCLVPRKDDPYEPPTSRIPVDQDADEARGLTRASTDQGDVSYQMPSLSVGFSLIPGPGGQGPHNPEFAVAAGTRDAFEKCLRVGKAMAGTALDVLSQKNMLQAVRSAWEKDMESYG